MTRHETAIVALLRRLGGISLDDATIRMVDCGLHSGFPACCVVFFVEVWWPANAIQQSRHARRSLRKQARAATDNYRDVFFPLGVDYVPCPSCARARTFVSSRPCGAHLSKRQRDNVRKAVTA